MARPEIGIYLPHMGLPYEDVERRARRCEDSGIDSVWLYDHLFAPGMPDYPSLEAWTLATALLARTDRLRIGHIGVCNQFRHPFMLAKKVTTIDPILGGRLSLGIGSGSIEDEHRRAGLSWGTFAARSTGGCATAAGPGEAFSTAMGCLILEIPYDFLPIFHR